MHKKAEWDKKITYIHKYWSYLKKISLIKWTYWDTLHVCNAFFKTSLGRLPFWNNFDKEHTTQPCFDKNKYTVDLPQVDQTDWGIVPGVLMSNKSQPNPCYIASQHTSNLDLAFENTNTNDVHSHSKLSLIGMLKA